MLALLEKYVYPKKNCIFFIQSCIFETRRPARVYIFRKVKLLFKMKALIFSTGIKSFLENVRFLIIRPFEKEYDNNP